MIYDIILYVGDGAVSVLEFKKGMAECGLQLGEMQLTQLFAFFDKDRSGSIDFEEFLQGVRVRRRAYIDRRMNGWIGRWMDG